MYAARLAPRHAMSEAPHSLGVSDSRHSLAAAAVGGGLAKQAGLHTMRHLEPRCQTPSLHLFL